MPGGPKVCCKFIPSNMPNNTHRSAAGIPQNLGPQTHISLSGYPTREVREIEGIRRK